jgi:hypothetical protein
VSSQERNCDPEMNPNVFFEKLRNAHKEILLDNHLGPLMDYTNKHFLWIDEQMGRYVWRFEKTYNLILDLMLKVNYLSKESWTQQKRTQFVLLTSNLKSIYSSHLLNSKGLYEDSITTIRPVYEAMVMTVFISCFPENCDSVINPKPQKGKRKFNITNFIENDLGLNWNHYAVMSGFAHLNRYSLVKHTVEHWESVQSREIKPVWLKIESEKETFSLGSNYCLFILYFYLNMLSKFFLHEEGEFVTSKDFSALNRIIELERGAIDFHDKDFWKYVYVDLDDVLLMMKEIEFEGDWESVFKRIRGT